MTHNRRLLENIQSFFLASAILLLLLHLYWTLYGYIETRVHQTMQPGDWMLFLLDFFDNVLLKIDQQLSLFTAAKGYLLHLVVLACLACSWIDPRPTTIKKKPTIKEVSIWFLASLLILLLSKYILSLPCSLEKKAITYTAVIAIAYLGITRGLVLFNRYKFKKNLTEDLWNAENETFPQEEKLMDNADSINLPTEYVLKGKKRKGWINIINPYRGTLIVGTAGAGKTYFCINHFIDQQIKKGYAMCIYDWKYPSLSTLAYNKLSQYKTSYPIKPEFIVIDFDNPAYSYRCNPLQPKYLAIAADANSIAKAMVESMNRHAIEKQGEFFTESAQNLIAAGIWFLRLYNHGQFCTIPHLIELLLLKNPEMFALMCLDERVENFVKPFQSALEEGAVNQLEGQVGTARLQFGKLSSPEIFWTLTKDEAGLDINNPEKPKILCLANNPSRSGVYSPLLSVCLTSMLRIINKANQHKTSIILDEFPTIYFPDVEKFLATARENKIATTMAIQDISQVRKGYGKDQADVIINNPANVICGQTSLETAKNISARIGNTWQEKQSISQHHQELSGSLTTQVDQKPVVPVSRIARLSAGEFVGILSDNPDQRLKQNAFYASIINDHQALKAEKEGYQAIPHVKAAGLVTEEKIMENFLKVKNDIAGIVEHNREKFNRFKWYKKLKAKEEKEEQQLETSNQSQEH